MNPKQVLFLTLGWCVYTIPSVACIQTMQWREIPRDSRQLPADIFKLHVHIDSEPLQIEVPMLGGTTKVALGRKTTDPQGGFSSIISKYEADPAKYDSFADRNDYGAALLFAGRYTDAVEILVLLEKDHPGQYATAANLGTAYELVGEVTQALAWIKQGIVRNAGSHDGTEWLHVAILEAKENLQHDPKWLEKHSVLEGNEERSRAVKEKALEYQLNERLYFIHENDPIMCDLFYQAAITTEDPAKKAYFLKQVPRFGSIRDSAMRRLAGK